MLEIPEQILLLPRVPIQYLALLLLLAAGMLVMKAKMVGVAGVVVVVAQPLLHLQVVV
jgi:hypothetical protein